MKIAIHRSSWGFSQNWIEYCQKRAIPFKIVNCYDHDIIQQLDDCDILLWHHHHTIAKDALFAKELLFALEQSGKKVFPEFNSGWHFDDKVGQKYLLEAVKAPVPPSWVFYEKEKAIRWADSASYPKVFKLRGGAGSTNVKLVKSKSVAFRLINRAFGQGFPSYNKYNDLNEQWLKWKKGELKLIDLLKSIRRFFVSTEFAKTVGAHKGYIYFQEFLPNNKYDVRVVAIGKRAYAFKRLVRKGDFRASGSGLIEYQKHIIDERCVQIAFDVTHKLKATCLAFDFVFDQENSPIIVEISYGFAGYAYVNCPGYWDEKINWHEGNFNPMEWIMDEILGNSTDDSVCPNK